MKVSIIKISYLRGKPANPKKLRVTQKFKELALKRNHVEKGGHYMDESEMPRYFALSERTEQIKEQVKEEKKSVEVEEITVPVKKVRRRKPAEE